MQPGIDEGFASYQINLFYTLGATYGGEMPHVALEELQICIFLGRDRSIVGTSLAIQIAMVGEIEFDSYRGGEAQR